MLNSPAQPGGGGFAERRGGVSRLYFLAVAGGLVLAILLTFLMRSGSGAAQVGFVFFCTVETVPTPEFPRVLTTIAFEPLPLYVLLAIGAGYLLAFREVRKGSSARLATRGRLISFCIGLVLVIFTVFGPLAAYSNTFLTAHMIQHFVLITIAPPLLLSGAPLTLLLVAAGKNRRDSILYPLLRAKWFHYFTNPVIGVLLFALIPVAWYVTPAFEASLTNAWLHHVSYALFLFAGIHYWWPVIGGNPSSWNMPYPARALYLFALVPIHAFLGSMFYEPSQVMFEELHAIPRTWGPSPLLDQQIAGTMMFVVGELIGLASLFIVMVRWSQADDRQAKRGDARRARQAAILDAERGVSRGLESESQ